jgi:hypothetical protein
LAMLNPELQRFTARSHLLGDSCLMKLWVKSPTHDAFQRFAN